MEGIKEKPSGITAEELRRFGGVESLAQKLWRAHLRHWGAALEKTDSQLQVFLPGVGPGTVAQLRLFQWNLEQQRKDAWIRPEHFVEISPFLKEKFPNRRLLFIDGMPFVFIDPAINFYMISLLRGELIEEKTLSNRGIFLEDLQKDVDFLNRYFKLGLGLKRGDELNLKIPRTTKVISSPSFSVQ